MPVAPSASLHRHQRRPTSCPRTGAHRDRPDATVWAPPLARPRSTPVAARCTGSRRRRRRRRGQSRRCPGAARAGGRTAHRNPAGRGSGGRRHGAHHRGDSNHRGHGVLAVHDRGARGRRPSGRRRQPRRPASRPGLRERGRDGHDRPGNPAELPPLDHTTEHHYTFTVTEQIQDIAAGLTRAVWTYNGTSPGPILHGRVGDTFHVALVNHGSMGHSIDFHAGELAPDGPMRTIEPGQQLEYTFTATRAGIWMYHCSTMPMSQHIANGMFGAVVIEPDDLPPVERQYVLIQSEEYLGADGGPANPAKVATGIPDLVAFNGRAFQYDAHPLTAHVDDLSLIH